MKTTKLGKYHNNTQFVCCKKDIGTFKAGKYYIVSGMYGDPQGSLEAGNEFLTTEFLNAVVIMDNKKDNIGEDFFLNLNIKINVLLTTF